ncbi:MAG: hypothetical protein QOI80_2836, partial [Solirubrobacteraceae bacterium]|nr:hypothetical protein [Solirubrobacteraceae bacterium]
MTHGAQEAGAPRSRLETSILHLWREALGVDAVGVHDTFFGLGGDSLKAVRLLSSIEEVLGVQVPFGEFLQAPTVAGIAEQVAALRAGAAPPAPAPPAPVVADVSRAPCTHAQERLWFLDQAGAAGAYNLPLCARIRGPLDADRLIDALQQIVDRHEALRTTFAVEDRGPVQVIAPALAIDVERHDLRGHPEPEAEARRIAETMTATAFDLERGPLLRAALLRIGDADHVLASALHHIICDGWSHAVILGELGELYGGTTPAPVETQYADVARRQRAAEHETSLEATVAWWAERLADAPAALELPADHPRPPVLSAQGATHRSRLSPELSDGVRAYAREAGTTTYVTLVAAYAALLGRLSGQETVVVGTTTSGRASASLEHAVGFFANTVALRCELGDEPTFAQLVAATAAYVRDAIAHDEAPFERVVAALDAARDPSRHPVFQVFFAQAPPLALPIAGAEPFPVSVPGARFEIVLTVEDDADGLTLLWEHSTELFETETIARMDRQFARLLESALAGPQLPVARLALMDAAERGAAIASGAAVAADQPVGCLHERFAAQAAGTPDAAA